MRTSEIHRILNNQIRKHKTPSVSYIFFSKDSIIYQARLGLADVQQARRVDEQTKYNAFSVTKTFTALAILQLEEIGKLDINQPVKKYLPDFYYPAEITIKQILAHTSGIPNPIPLSWIHTVKEHQTFNRNAFFNAIFKKYHKVMSGPNEKYTYSNIGYVILGQLIERVSGKTYEAYINDNIIKFLDISPDDLVFEIVDLNRYAKGYQKWFSFTNAFLGLFIDKSKFMCKPEGKWKPFQVNYVNGSSYGGLIGTPDAFVRYIQELLRPGSRLISNQQKTMLFTENLTNKGKSTGMCLAWSKGQMESTQYFSHAGGGGGFYCEIRIYPEQLMGSVIMFNRTGMTDERFLDKLDGVILKEKSDHDRI